MSVCFLLLWCAVTVFCESEAEAGYRRADPDWSSYTGAGGRRYRKGQLVRPKKSQIKQKKLPGNKEFSKRISAGKKNPISSQYPAKPGQPLGLILNVGDQRKSYQKRPSVKKPIIKKSDNFSQKKFKKILKRKGFRGKGGKVKLVRRKPILRLSSPQKTFRPKKGSTFSLPKDRVFNDFYPSGTIGHAVLNLKKAPSSGGSYKHVKHVRPYKKPSVYKPPKKQQSYKPIKKPQQSYKPAPKPQQSYTPAKKPEVTYKEPAKKPQQSYKPVKEPAYKPPTEYKPVESSYNPPESSYKPSEPAYKPESDYKPPESSYKPAEPVYKPQADYAPSYKPDLPKNVYKPEPSYEPSYEPEEVTSYKPPKIDYKQPEYDQQEVTSYKPPAEAYKPQQQGFNDFPNFPMPDFSSFLQASFEPDFSFELPKLNSK